MGHISLDKGRIEGHMGTQSVGSDGAHVSGWFLGPPLPFLLSSIYRRFNHLTHAENWKVLIE